MSKIQIVINYFAQFDEILMVLIFLEYVEFFTVFLSIIMFFIIYRKNHINTVLYKSFKKMPKIQNQIFLTWFTLFFAIPNKIWVNNKVSNFLTSCSVYLIIMISHIFPCFILFYLMFWIMVLESYFFAIFYEERKSFKKFIDSSLFLNNTRFAKEYFDFFWGNMARGGSGKSRAGLIGTILGGFYRYSREQEKAYLRVKTKQEMDQHMANAQHKPQTAQESLLQLQKEIENHIVDRDLPSLSLEKAIKNYMNW